MRMVGVVVGVVAGALLLGGCTSSANDETGSSPAAASAAASPFATPSESPSATVPSASATPSPTGPIGYADVVEGGQLTTAAICAAYEKKIATYGGAAAKRLAGGKGKAGNAYVAADYRRTHDWVKDPLVKRFRESMTALATSALNQVSDGQAGLVEDLDAYLAASLAACGLDTAYAKAQSAVQSSVDLGARIRAKANAKPWYPRGFEPFGGDLAIRWIDNADVDCFSRCWYWTLEVVSETGCPSGVYAELSISRGGTAVAWTNDSLSALKPRQRGRMQFITYDDQAYGGTGSLAELNCY